MIRKNIINQQLKPYADAVNLFLRRRFDSHIWGVHKTRPALELHVTNQNGLIIFYTDPNEIGQNYVSWRDVFLTLKGQYGARMTEIDPKATIDGNKKACLESPTKMYVAAPSLLQSTV